MDKEYKMEFVEVNGRKFPYWYGIGLELGNCGRVTAFYSYTSVVRDVILQTGFSHNDAFDHLRENFVVEAQIEGIPAHVDNKIVFEVTSSVGRKTYFGWYDGRFSIGMDVYTEYPTNEHRKEFKVTSVVD